MTTVRMDAAGDNGFTSSTDADFANRDRAEIQEKPAARADSSLSSSPRDALVLADTIGRSDDRVAIGRIAERDPAQIDTGRWKPA
jgi:hypothetical protein